ncbi:MAG: IS66 family transposase [Terracidiphilus sp.]
MEAVNPASKSPLPVVLDPVVAAIIAQLKQEMKQAISAKDRIIALSEMRIQKLEEELRLERIKKYGKQSEKLSDLQLKLLDLEPAVSSDEIKAEIERGPLPESAESNSATDKQRRSRQNHPGRNELPASLERIDKIIPCAPEFCTCGKCGGDTKVIGYDVSEVLDRKPAAYFVTRIMREKRACAHCIEQGVVTAPTPVRIAPKSIFSDETIVNFLISKYADATPLYRQHAGLQRDFDIDVALSTINDSVLRAGELLIPIIDWMKRDLLAGNYIQADETYVGVQTEEKTGRNHTAYFWQYSAPGKGVVFDFEMTRSKEVPKAFFKDYGGILHTDGYVAYEKDIGTEKLIHACCLAHSRRKFIEAIKVQTKAHVADPKLDRVVALMDEMFAIDREAREQKLSLEDRHALRQEHVPVVLAELHALLFAMQESGTILPKSIAGNAISYTLTRWEKLTRFIEHPVIELSTNWAENSMRPIGIGRKNWLHIGSKEAGPKIAAIFSIVESCRKLNVHIRQYLLDVLPGLADRSIQTLAELTPAAYAARIAK